MAYNFERITVDEITLTKCQKLLDQTFSEWESTYSYKYLEWLYKKNPAGHVVGYNAYTKDRLLAAHYATIPINAEIYNKKVKGLLSLNTATHSSHRGKGLFTQLAERTYNDAEKEDYDFVIGVANQNSTSGFIDKLNFQLVAPLDVRVGIGNTPPKNSNQDNTQFSTIKDNDFLQWRLNKPNSVYRANQKNNTIYSKTAYPYFEAILTSLDSSQSINLEQVNLITEIKLSMKLWIGINDSINWTLKPYFPLPNKLKPSPLNLIYKDLSGKLAELDRSQIIFEALDFDAY